MVHGPQFLDPVVHNIVPLTAIRQILVVKVPTQHIDVPIIKTDRMRRTPVLQFVDQLQRVVLEVKFVDILRFLVRHTRLSTPDEIKVPVRHRNRLMEVRQLEVYRQGDRLELRPALQVQVVQDVLVVLEKVKVPPRTVIAERVHPDYLLRLSPQPLLARLTRKV